MSWRLLSVFLLILAVLATLTGLRAGHWLGAHVPEQANLPNTMQNDPAPAVDANGRPIYRQPEQPLMSGNQGVPAPLPLVDWKIDPHNRSTADAAALSGTDVQYDLTQGVTISHVTGSTVIKSSEFDDAPPPDTSSPAWVNKFRQAMIKCRSKSFADRPSCLRNVRQRYCGANNAWGQVMDCPKQ